MHSSDHPCNGHQLIKCHFLPSPIHCPLLLLSVIHRASLWFPGHFPKLVQPLAFWTSEFKYCQIRFKSRVKAWWVHHCPQFKKHYRGHDIATKRVALILPLIKGRAMVCITPKEPAPPAWSPGPATCSFPILTSQPSWTGSREPDVNYFSNPPLT